MDEQTFRERLARDGFDEVVVLQWEPDRLNDVHTHDFDARILVLEGSITVMASADSNTLEPGDWSELGAGVRHAERMGPDGVRLLVGRRRPAGRPPAV